MSPFEQLVDVLQSEFTDAEFVVRKADDPNGVQFLNLYLGSLEVAIEWKPDAFGLSCFHSSCHELEGAFDAPDEWYRTPQATFHRVVSLLLEEQTTKEAAVSIGQIRRELGMSQEEVSTAIDVTQATYSKQERRADMKVSTLKRAIEAMGGILRIEARFPDSQNVRELTF